MTPITDSLPSREELLRDGGLYPIPAPLEWKLIGAEGEDVAIPHVEGSPFHRILARGALLAAETEPQQPPELMTLRKLTLPSPLPSALLEQYSAQLRAHLSKNGIESRLIFQELAPCALTVERCAKLVLERRSASDDRTELRYLLCDRTGQGWELAYLLRRDNLAAWSPLLAEIDGYA